MVSFVGAFALGAGVAYLFAPAGVVLKRTDCGFGPRVRVIQTVSLNAEDLRGTWTGTWGRNREYSTIEIERVLGNSFHGTLRKEGAVISIAGSLDPEKRTVFFHETKVRKLGTHMSEWSLGTNSGSFSPDGRTLTGFGTDKWGSYGWDATKE